MIFTGTLRALRIRRELLVARSDQQRQDAGEAFTALAQRAASVARFARPARLLEGHPALAAGLTLAFVVLRRRLKGRPLLRLLLLEPVIRYGVRLLWSVFVRRREAAARPR